MQRYDAMLLFRHYVFDSKLPFSWLRQLLWICKYRRAEKTIKYANFLPIYFFLLAHEAKPENKMGYGQEVRFR
jgi:hypothetical protein